MTETKKKKKITKKKTEFKFEYGDRVKRIDGDSINGYKVAIVDMDKDDPYAKSMLAQGRIFVKTRSEGWCTGTDQFQDDLEKVEDYTINVQEFFADVNDYLYHKRLNDKDNEKIYHEILKHISKCRHHIGY